MLRQESPWKNGVISISLCLAIAAAYLPTFSGEFILDDRPFVKDNPYIRDFQSVLSYLSQEDGIGGPDSGERHSGYYRPLVNVTYTLDSKIWGMEAPGFRLTNLVLHMISCAALYLCLRAAAGASRIAALIGAISFGLHPANTESVAWIASRNNILVTLFCLLSFYFYEKRVGGYHGPSGFLSLTCFALALMCKEFAVMLLPILVVYDRCRRAEEGSAGGPIWRYLAFLYIVLAYLMLRHIALHGSLMRPYDLSDGLKALYFAPYLVLFSLRIIFLPLGLHNFMVSYPDGYWGKEAILGFTAMGLMGWAAWRRRGDLLLLFSFLSFLLALFPVLNVLPTSAYSIISMRWLYFPMAFLVFGLVLVVDRLRKRLGHMAFGVSTCLVLFYLGSCTYLMNDGLWKREEAFFEREVLQFENHFFAGDLARIYQAKGDLAGAARYYQIALEGISPDRNGLLINYAGLLIQLGRPDEALPYLGMVKVQDITKEQRAGLFNNTGAARFMEKEYEDAARWFEKATLFSAGDHSIWTNLGKARRRAGQFQKAIEALERAMKAGADPLMTKLTMAQVCLDAGDQGGAGALLNQMPKEILEKDPAIQGLLRQVSRQLESSASGLGHKR